MNCCNHLSKEFDEIFLFLIDVHSGIYRFIKIIENKIVRFFERDHNHNTGEFGELIREEKELQKENREHSCFHVDEVVDKVLEFSSKLVNSNAFKEKVIIGKRYLKAVEKYKENIILLEKHKPATKEEIEALKDEELPF